MSEYHVPVMLQESVSMLVTDPDGVYVDATFGGGGHSRGILSMLSEKGRLIAFDTDEDARANLPEDNRITLIHNNFRFIHNFLLSEGYSGGVNGILADLGVSSPDFDDEKRGFSYSKDGPLDMRMDPSLPVSARDVVNRYDERRLSDIIYRYGEDPDARRIARAIVAAREEKEIATTLELAEIIKEAKSPKERAKKGHPAKQAFQAIRIEVNHELDALEAMLGEIPGMLAPKGRAVVITFHSLEDRLVKRAFRSLTRPERGNRNDPSSLNSKTEEPEFIDLTPHPIVAGEEERKENRRSLSSKLRAIERKGD